MSSATQLRREKMRAAVLIIGGVSILTATVILTVLHLLRYLPAAAGILIGLHLLPLVGVYRQRLFRIFGYLLVAWSAGCLLLTTHVALFSSIGEVSLIIAMASTIILRKRTALTV